MSFSGNAISFACVKYAFIASLLTLPSAVNNLSLHTSIMAIVRDIASTGNKIRSLAPFCFSANVSNSNPCLSNALSPAPRIMAKPSGIA